MNINWKVRIKNPVFWVTVIPSIVSVVYLLLAAFGVTPSVTENVIIDGLLAVVGALTTVGVLVDPTTKGVSDSKQAMEYVKPKSDTTED
jgi:phi LC3 family holin